MSNGEKIKSGGSMAWKNNIVNVLLAVILNMAAVLVFLLIISCMTFDNIIIPIIVSIIPLFVICILGVLLHKKLNTKISWKVVWITNIIAITIVGIRLYIESYVIGGFLSGLVEALIIISLINNSIVQLVMMIAHKVRLKRASKGKESLMK